MKFKKIIWLLLAIPLLFISFSLLKTSSANADRLCKISTGSVYSHTSKICTDSQDQALAKCKAVYGSNSNCTYTNQGGNPVSYGKECTIISSSRNITGYAANRKTWNCRDNQDCGTVRAGTCLDPAPPATPPAPSNLSTARACNETSSNISFNWSAVGNATSYNFKAMKNGVTLISSTQSSPNYWKQGSAYDTTYSWTVQACAGTSNCSAPKSGSNVTSLNCSPTIQKPASPGFPRVSTPQCTGTANQMKATFSWNSVTAANSYKLLIKNKTTGATVDERFLPKSGNSLPTSKEYTLPSNVDYGWSVQACATDTNCSDKATYNTTAKTCTANATCETKCKDANRECGSIDGCSCGTCPTNQDCKRELINPEANNKYGYICVKPTKTPDNGTCSEKAPTLNPEANKIEGKAGETKKINVNIKNNDSNCSTNKFIISIESKPSNNWDVVIDKPNQQIKPQNTAGVSVSITSPKDATKGTRTITIGVRKESKNKAEETVILKYEVTDTGTPSVTNKPPKPVTVTPEPPKPVTPIPEPPTPTPVPPTPEPGKTRAYFTVGLDGIGNTLRVPTTGTLGGNVNPQHPNRRFTVFFYRAGQEDTAIFKDTQTFTYNSTSRRFEGFVDLSSDVNSDTYNVFITAPRYLISRYSNSIAITSGQDLTLPVIDLITGNINNLDTSANRIDLSDYQVLISCSIFSTDNKAACNEDSRYQTWADLNDDGLVDQDDYTLWLYEMLNQEGAQLPNSGDFENLSFDE